MMSAQDNAPTQRELLTVAQVAEKIDVSTSTLGSWRSTGRHALPFIKIGGKVRYRASDLDAWLASRTRESGATA